MRIKPVEGRRREGKPNADLTAQGILGTPDGFPDGTPASSSGGDLAVLIVDDDVGIRKSHTKLLERAGFTVASVESALEAFEAIELHTFGAILCDIQMPGLSGTSFFEQLEERMPHMASRVVFLSGYVDQPDTFEFLKRSGQPFLAKPATRDQLVNTVGSMVQRTGWESGLSANSKGKKPPTGL